MSVGVTMTDPMLHSPIHQLPGLSAKLGIDLWVKRDDLIPLALGGNKARKNHYILSEHLKLSGRPDALITNGGAQSNHARVVALLGAMHGIQTHLILHGESSNSGLMAGNEFFFKASRAHCHYTTPDAIRNVIDDTVNDLMSQGKRGLVIPGGGHSSAGARAYHDAVAELPFEPDYIVHASGTGGTQAGLIDGTISSDFSTSVIGVSVAREKERGTQAILDLLVPPQSTHGQSGKGQVDLRDDFRFGGYGKYDQALVNFIESMVGQDGLPLDPTYTGKAFYGLCELVETGEIPCGSKVVFWHTGGLLNLQTSQILS